MKKFAPYIIVAIIVIVGVVLLVGHNSTTKTVHTTTTTSSAAVATDTVTISNYAFSPGNITVKKGTTVTWTNKDSVAHTVAETDGKTGPSSNDLNQNQTYSFTYNTVGTFKYNCGIHPNMLGTVTVTD